MSSDTSKIKVVKPLSWQTPVPQIPVTCVNLSGILRPLRPEHRQIILDRLPEAILDGTIQASPKKEASTRMPNENGQRRVRSYINLAIEDTPSFQEWLKNSATEYQEQRGLREGFGPELIAEIIKDPERFDRLAEQYKRQLQQTMKEVAEQSPSQVTPGSLSN